jgi:sterol desaturase/sphingolipid hydroxylase (fatty acid hydroxylase superfamily)
MPIAALAHEPLIRLGAFAGVFTAMALWEALAPRRPRAVGRGLRWPSNLGVVVLDTLVVRALFPTSAVGLALLAEARGFGLLHWLGVPAWFAVPFAVVALDLVIYAQHIVFHFVPWLWRLHRMHHADLDFDVTTALRFHPVEILLSLLLKLAVVAALGAPAVSVLAFEVLLNATAMFNHANASLPPWLERWVRTVMVTPDMHRIHHSAIRVETNSNYGFNLSVWDRLFGTYRAQPGRGHEGMTIGLDYFREPADLRLDRMLLQPLR